MWSSAPVARQRASFAHTFAGDWTNSGTFAGNTSTVTFSGAGANLAGQEQNNFTNLTSRRWYHRSHGHLSDSSAIWPPVVPAHSPTRLAVAVRVTMERQQQDPQRVGHA